MKTHFLKSIPAICVLHLSFYIYPSAQIVYTDVNPDVTSTGTYNLDLDNDGTTDFVITHTTGPVINSNSCQGSRTNHSIKVSPSNQRKIADYSGTNATNMGPNSTIDASTLTWKGQNNQLMVSENWVCSCNYYYCVWSPSPGGQWYDAYDGFLGLRLTSGGHSYYGWLRMNTSGGSAFTIKDYAYNSTADQAIPAGQSSTEYLEVSPISGSWPTPLCAGKNVTVPYTITGIFSVSNIVTAELSDATGSFTNPVAIGNVISNYSGNISAVIPANIPTGAAYRIRVKSSNPVRTSYTNGSNLYVVGGLPNGTIYAYGSTNTCDGNLGSVYLYTSTDFCYSYQWQLNGNDISGATSDSYVASATGDYSCVKNNGVGSVTSNIITVTTQPTPLEIYACWGESTIVCGGTVLLCALSSGNYTYQWKLNGNSISGATSDSYVASATGDYSCVKTNICGSVTSNSMSVSIYPDMAPAVLTLVGATIVCSGPVTLNANTGAGLSYQWYKNSEIISGATSSSYSASVSGNYNVIETNSYGCTRISNEIVLVIGPSVGTVYPASGTICQGNDVFMYVSPYIYFNSYQWIKDGEDISGATGQSYSTNHTGIYAVRATLIEGGCSETSTDIPITHCNNNNLITNNSFDDPRTSLSVAPNPLSELANISFNLEQSENVSLRIFDVSGRLITTLADTHFEEGEYNVEWNSEGFVPGIYFLRFDSNHQSLIRTLIITK